jgi:chromate transporter
MARNLAPDKTRASIAALGALSSLLLVGAAGQLVAIVVGVTAGLILCRGPAEPSSQTVKFRIGRRAGVACLVVFVTLLVGLPLATASTQSSTMALLDVFYRAGALVFGGGHVVLPLLHTGLVEPGWVSEDVFLTGYGAAQAVPGPLFTFATYLGAVVDVGPGGALGAAMATVAIFAPGFLLLVGVLPFWNTFRDRPWLRALMRGANAAVVGILAAALYDPIFTSAISGPPAFCLALICFVLMTAWRVPSWAVVVVAALGGVALAL